MHNRLDKRQRIGRVHRIQHNLHYHRKLSRVYNLRAMRGATYRNFFGPRQESLRDFPPPMGDVNRHDLVEAGNHFVWCWSSTAAS